jgi:DNA-binding Xre family transcriptional regulator
MLIFNPKKILLLRGVEKIANFMVKNGFTYQSAGKILKGRNSLVKVKDIERLCVALNCTPNDLFEWKTDQTAVLPDGHSLNGLSRGEGTKNLQEMVKDVPSDKLALIENLLDALKP